LPLVAASLLLGLVLGYAALATIVEPAAIDPVVLDDPDDDDVLACAIAIGAEVIVSGDGHLLDLEEYQGIPILSAAELLARIQTPESSPESSTR
jgi:predicted nucleic acid-binding protein